MPGLSLGSSSGSSYLHASEPATAPNMTRGRAAASARARRENRPKRTELCAFTMASLEPVRCGEPRASADQLAERVVTMDGVEQVVADESDLERLALESVADTSAELR